MKADDRLMDDEEFKNSFEAQIFNEEDTMISSTSGNTGSKSTPGRKFGATGNSGVFRVSPGTEN